MIDTHAHLFLSKRSEDAFIQQSLDRGVTHIINVATSLQNSRDAALTAQRYPQVSSTVGIHPCEIDRTSDAEWQAIPDLVRQLQAIAIGEIGLDGYRGPISHRQIDGLHYQLSVAQEMDLPAIIHCRNAAAMLAPILCEYPLVRKVIHCFSEDESFIEAVDGPNTFYSFTGIVTYSNASNTLHAARVLPLEKIMLDTDSPYLTPAPYKGQENFSGLVDAVATAIGSVRQISVDTVISATTNTARSFFKLAHDAV